MVISLRFSTAPLVRKPQIIHCPSNYVTNNVKRAFYYLFVLKGDSNADLCIFQQILSVHPDDLAGFDTGKLSFFPCQSLCTREIQLDEMARPDRRRYRKCNKDACLADITASAVNEPVRFRYPNTDRPGDTAPAIFSLLN